MPENESLDPSLPGGLRLRQLKEPIVRRLLEVDVASRLVPVMADSFSQIVRDVETASPGFRVVVELIRLPDRLERFARQYQLQESLEPFITESRSARGQKIEAEIMRDVVERAAQKIFDHYESDGLDASKFESRHDYHKYKDTVMFHAHRKFDDIAEDLVNSSRRIRHRSFRRQAQPKGLEHLSLIK